MKDIADPVVWIYQGIDEYIADITVDLLGSIYTNGSVEVAKINNLGVKVWRLDAYAFPDRPDLTAGGVMGRYITAGNDGYIYTTHDGHGENGTPAVRQISDGGSPIWLLTDTGGTRGLAFKNGYLYVTYDNSLPPNFISIRKLNSNSTNVWSLTDVANGLAVDVDSLNNVYVVHSDYDTNLISGKALVRKLDSYGVEQWRIAHLGDPRSVAVDPIDDSIYVAYHNAVGLTNVQKLNSAGVQQWALTDIGQALAVKVDHLGFVYVIYDNPLGTVNIRKLTKDGVQVWALSDTVAPIAIAINSSNDIFVLCSWYSPDYMHAYSAIRKINGSAPTGGGRTYNDGFILGMQVGDMASAANMSIVIPEVGPVPPTGPAGPADDKDAFQAGFLQGFAILGMTGNRGST